MRTLASFAELADIKLNLISRDSDRKAVNDVVDFENGTLIVNRNNLTKYLERYSCKDEDDLSDTLWYSYGVFLKIV